MPEISENSRRIAKNSILLYFRMLLLMFIGLFTSRIVLQALGVDDYGVYGAVGGLVMMFTVVTNSVSQSISRYITWHLGVVSKGQLANETRSGDAAPREPLSIDARSGDAASREPLSIDARSGDAAPEGPLNMDIWSRRGSASGPETASAPGTTSGLHRVFSTAVIMQLIFCGVLLIVTETLGVWWLENKMNIPAGSMPAASWVLQCSMGVLMINLLSVPFNATIISHERMDVFAWISIGEAVLKLSVALLIAGAAGSRLKMYALLMLAVALVVRLTYGLTCRRLFEETRGKPVFDGKLLKEMTSFAGWNMLGSGAYIVNTQGVNQLANIFFGVAVNSARSLALQVENTVKQFINNLLTALNPQITKSYAAGDRNYSFELIGKGVKYSGIILLALGLPIFLETPELLRIWLKSVPEHTAIFVRLTIFCIAADLLLNPLLTLIQADGRIKGYYIVSSLVALTSFAASWIAFRAGAPAYVSYVFFTVAYLLVDAIKVIYARRLAGYTLSQLFGDALGPVLAAALLTSAVPILLHFILPEGGWRLLAVLASTALFILPVCWELAFTPGEREFVLRKTARWLPTPLFLRMKYRCAMDKRLRLCRPWTFTEKLQWQKLHDRNPLYHKLVDKADVKAYVASKIGDDHVIPTLGVWDNPEDIDWNALPNQFVLKCTHDSGSTIICRDKISFDRDDACARLAAALKDNFWRRAREWPYKGLKPRIIAEPYIGAALSDYKIFCFRGKPGFLFVATDRDNPEEETKFDFFTPEWRHMDLRNGHPNADQLPAKPEALEEMLRLASVLAEDFPQVRIDFYAPGDGRVLFGEYTFCHWGGFVPFDPSSADMELGRMFKLSKR